MFFSQFSRPQWLFFDLDDTLWDFKKNSEETLRYVFSNFKEINSRFKSPESFLDTYHMHNDVLWKDFADGKISSELLKTERWRRTLFANSDPMSPPEICRVIDARYLSILATKPYLTEGAEELLHSLSKKYMIAVLSNGFIDTQYHKLKFSGLWKYITRTVVSDEAGFQKPDPNIYKYAMEATGATGTPIMIGDNPKTDILGALRSGWKAVWYNPYNKEFPLSYNDIISTGINPDLYLGSISHLKELETLLTRHHQL